MIVMIGANESCILTVIYNLGHMVRVVKVNLRLGSAQHK